jgi:hypothetical protein
MVMAMADTYIIWPEERRVPEGVLWGWYEDAVANGKIADEYLHAHDLQTAQRALSDAGLITVGVERDDEPLPQGDHEPDGFGGDPPDYFEVFEQ